MGMRRVHDRLLRQPEQRRLPRARRLELEVQHAPPARAVDGPDQPGAVRERQADRLRLGGRNAVAASDDAVEDAVVAVEGDGDPQPAGRVLDRLHAGVGGGGADPRQARMRQQALREVLHIGGGVVGGVVVAGGEAHVVVVGLGSGVARRRGLNSGDVCERATLARHIKNSLL